MKKKTFIKSKSEKKKKEKKGHLVQILIQIQSKISYKRWCGNKFRPQSNLTLKWFSTNAYIIIKIQTLFLEGREQQHKIYSLKGQEHPNLQKGEWRNHHHYYPNKYKNKN